MLGLGHFTREGSNKPRYQTETSAEFTKSESDYITIANHADFQIDGANFTATFWINFTEDATGSSNKDGPIGLIAGRFRNGGFWFEYNDAAGDSEKIAFFTDTGSAKTSILSTTNITHDTWYFVAATYGLSATTAKLYINGALEATDTSMSAPSAYTSDIGVGSWTPYASCLVKDVAMWNGAVLAAEEINSLYTTHYEPTQIQGDSLIGWWPLDAESATGSDNVIEQSGVGHHGTTTNLVDSDFDTADSPTGV